MYPVLSDPVRKAAKKSWDNPTIDNDGTRDSPNGTRLRSESPNSFGDSPRDRSNVHKDSYAHRIRDKDNQPPLERERPRDSDRRNNNDRGSTKENTQLVGDWTEHVTSSGKFFYYNCKLEFSQWEKPRDWVDWEKDEEKERYRRDRDRERKYDRQSYSTSRNSSSGSGTTSNNSNGSSSNVTLSRSTENHQTHQPQTSMPEQPQSRSYSSCGTNRIFILEFFISVFVFHYKIYLSRLFHWCFFFLRWRK